MITWERARDGSGGGAIEQTERGKRLVVNHVRQNEGCTRDETLRRWIGASWERGKDTFRGLGEPTEAPVDGEASVGTPERREATVVRGEDRARSLPDVAVSLIRCYPSSRERGGKAGLCLLKWTWEAHAIWGFKVAEARYARLNPRTTQSTGWRRCTLGVVWKTGTETEGDRRRRCLSEYNHRDSILCGPYDVDKRGTKRPPKNFGRPRSCQEVVLHVSHLVMLLGGSRQDSGRQLTRQGPFLAFGLR